MGLTLLQVTYAEKGNGVSTNTKERRAPATINPQVIYGPDDRLDLYQVTNPDVKTLAQSTVALIRGWNMELDADGNYNLQVIPYGERYNLCREEPFFEQASAAFCSGFLVGADLVATAGHCIKSLEDCVKTQFVFDFALTQQGMSTPTRLPAEKVFSCQNLIISQYRLGLPDFALARLDRPVTDRTPLKLNRLRPVVGDELTVIGHPAGLPTKVAGNSFVREIHLREGFFIANLDTYGGNSGSAVFNSTSGEVEGILVRGETDFVDKNGCRVSKRCPDQGCRGEDATLISELLPYLPNP